MALDTRPRRGRCHRAGRTRRRQRLVPQPVGLSWNVTDAESPAVTNGCDPQSGRDRR